jgi:hypothetical protein
MVDGKQLTAQQVQEQKCKAIKLKNQLLQQQRQREMLGNMDISSMVYSYEQLLIKF